MDATLKPKLIEALRSGKYQQGSGSLRNGDYFCVGGVVCDLVDPNAWEKVEGLPAYKWDSYFTLWPLEICELFETNEIVSLLNMNDKAKVSFSQIADWIETNC